MIQFHGNLQDQQKHYKKYHHLLPKNFISSQLLAKNKSMVAETEFFGRNEKIAFAGLRGV